MKKKTISKQAIKKIVAIIIAFFALLGVIVANIFYPLKYLGCLFVRHYSLQQGVAVVRYLDVGYGDCTVITLPDQKSILIDGGNSKYTTRRKVIKELNRCGISTLDYVICTSAKSEHCGALADVLAVKGAKKIFLPYCTYTYITEEYRSFYVAAKATNATLVYSEYGVREEGENWSLTFLSPTDHTLEQSEYTVMNSEHGDTNIGNASAVFWLQIYDTNLLFLGDTTSTIADKIVEEYELREALNEPYCGVNGVGINLPDCNILQVAAHGALAGRSQAFYNLLSPQMAIISVGTNNRSCPSIEVVADVTALARQTLNTANDGDIFIEITAAGYNKTN
jgi:competence protein ComEC